MKPITGNTPVEALGLSTRTANCLRRGHIDTVAQFLAASEETLMAIKNFGVNSLAEATAFTASLREGTNPDFVLVDIPEEGGDGSFSDRPFTTVEPQRKSVKELLSDSPDVLKLSVRSSNCLKTSGIDTLSKLARYSKEQLADLPNLGELSLKEITQKVQLFSEGIVPASREDETLLNYAKEAQFSFGRTVLYWLSVLLDIQSSRPDISPDTLGYLFGETEEIESAIKYKILLYTEKSGSDTFLISTLESTLPQFLGNTTVFSQQLINLENEGAVRILDDGYSFTRIFPSVYDALAGVPENKRLFMEYRLAGMTLEEIGGKFGKTRERVRQVIDKTASCLPRVREEKYRSLFERYALSESEFCFITGEPAVSYRYLCIVSKIKNADKKLPEDIPENDSLPVFIRKNAERLIYRDYLTVNGLRIKKDRPSLIKYYTSVYCRDLTKYEDIVSGYNAFLDSVGETSEKLHIAEDARTYENTFSGCGYMLCNVHHSYRYYDITEQNAAELASALRLSELQNVEISTLKLFREYPDVMAEYDIRDEYELHSLLNKIGLPESLFITFKRMPTLIFGKANKDDQLLDLMMETAPITAKDLAEKYEELYGFRVSTSLANEFRSLDPFFFRGVYRIDEKILPPGHKDVLKSLLTEDCYSIAEIKNIYTKACSDADPASVNAYTLKDLGFMVYSGYVVSNRFATVSEYVKSLLTARDVIDISDLPSAITVTNEFSSRLNSYRLSRELIEFAPHRYIRLEKLKTAGITLQDIDDYCEKAAQAAEPKAYFTIGSLYAAGFSHKLDDLGFEPFFYASLLAFDKNRFSMRRMGGNFLLFNSPRHIVELAGLVRSIVEQARKIEIDDLTELIRERYSLNIYHLREKLPDIATDAGLYYDKIMQAVYVDYDTFFDEI